jgi:adenylosuccinate lyase
MHITIKTTSKEKSDEALARIFKQISLYRDWLHVECYVDDHTIEFGVQENKHQKEFSEIKVEEIKEVKKSFKKINQKRIENQIISYESDDADIIWLE